MHARHPTDLILPDIIAITALGDEYKLRNFILLNIPIPHVTSDVSTNICHFQGEVDGVNSTDGQCTYIYVK